MMNKKGSLVLRDVMFMMIIVSAIFVFASLFVGEMASNYGNDNMSEEWAGNNIYSDGNSTFYSTSAEIDSTGEGLSITEGGEAGGLYGLISSVANALDGIGEALVMVLAAPNTLGGLIYGVLLDAGVAPSISLVIKYLIISILWGIIIFSIISAFLRGGKL